jgi:hypothetical protein
MPELIGKSPTILRATSKASVTNDASESRTNAGMAF